VDFIFAKEEFLNAISIVSTFRIASHFGEISYLFYFKRHWVLVGDILGNITLRIVMGLRRLRWILYSQRKNF